MLPQQISGVARAKTPRSRARIDNIKRLIEALRLGEMLRDDISELLAFSPSGTRKYITDLKAHEVIEVVRYVDPTPNSLGIPLYRLSPNAEKVDAFIAHLDSDAMRPAKKRGAPAGMDLAMRDQSRHFHFLQDDDGYLPRVPRLRDMERDPMVTALFGAPASAEVEVNA